MEIERKLICRPRGSMCMSCIHTKDDCSHLDFDSMLPIKFYGDIVEVSCTEYKRKDATI